MVGLAGTDFRVALVMAATVSASGLGSIATMPEAEAGELDPVTALLGVVTSDPATGPPLHPIRAARHLGAEAALRASRAERRLVHALARGPAAAVGASLRARVRDCCPHPSADFRSRHSPHLHDLVRAADRIVHAPASALVSHLREASPSGVRALRTSSAARFASSIER